MLVKICHSESSLKHFPRVSNMNFTIFRYDHLFYLVGISLQFWILTDETHYVTSYIKEENLEVLSFVFLRRKNTV